MAEALQIIFVILTDIIMYGTYPVHLRYLFLKFKIRV